MSSWTLTVFDHRGRTVSRLETASGLVLVPGRDRLDVHLAPIGRSRLARIREGSLSIGDLHIEAVRGIHDALVFAAWSSTDDVSIAGVAWSTSRAKRDVLAHLATLLSSSRVSPAAPGWEQLVAMASKLHRLAST
jgi:hypothetical protein